jgi:hypothetical protein
MAAMGWVADWQVSGSYVGKPPFIELTCSGGNAPPNKSSNAAPGALQSGHRFDNIMCTEQGGVCIPTGDEQAMTGGEPGGLVMVEIVHVKRPPEDQRVCEFKV